MRANVYRYGKYMYEHDMNFAAAGLSNTPVLLEVFQSAHSNVMESDEMNDYSWSEVPLPTLFGHTQQFSGRYILFLQGSLSARTLVCKEHAACCACLILQVLGCK